MNVESTLDSAQNYLQTQLNQGNHETFEIALALIALIPRLTHLDGISSHIDALRAAQLPNGSWDNDVYTTALALRALRAVETPADDPDTNPSNPDLMLIKGVVMDSSNNVPLENVAIVATFGDNTLELITSADGLFEIQDFTELEGQVSFSIDGYVALEFPLIMEPREAIDLGQVRLRPEIGEPLLPDLVVENVTLDVPVNPQTLVLSGQVTAEIKNIGTVSTSQAIHLLAFYDADRNSLYNEVDIILGESSVGDNLAIDETLSVDIAVLGQLPFRDAPIFVIVDSRKIIAEIREDNNVETTAKVCKATPSGADTFDAVIKWNTPWWRDRWISNHPPVVGPLQDTNGDGLINENDTPAVIASSVWTGSASGHAYGQLIAIDGKTGEKIWYAKAYSDGEGTTPALGDINGDGIPEIITISEAREIIALNNYGEIIWISQRWIVDTSLFAAISIVDLEGDGQAEIIVGNVVLDSEGNVKWKTEEIPKQVKSHRFAFTSVVADLDLDGFLEVIMDQNIYRFDGQAYLSSEAQVAIQLCTFFAIGDFDDDPYQEIVCSSGKNLFLFEHDATLKWGPVYSPGNLAGGTPVVADMDGDGYLDIGVSGKYHYQVFDNHGSLKWFIPIRDISSGGVGSSIFDLNGDGQLEIIHSDETKFRIIDASNGNILFSAPNYSITWQEYPTVADVDNDGHADILVPGYNGVIGSGNRGVTVYQGANNDWMPARGIWNQYTYHITNVNDDGSIPRVQKNPKNFHQQQQLSIPGTIDLTIGYLRVIDNGLGQPLSLKVRIGNAGAAPSPENLTLTFYTGDPANQGTVLGTITLDAFAPGTYQDIQLDNVDLTALDQYIYAVVDSGNGLAECNENNNSIALGSLETETTLNQLTLTATTNATTYGPNTPVATDYAVLNQGALSTDFQVEIRLEDADGNIVTLLQPATANTLISGDTLAETLEWNTGTTLAGNYQIHALLLSPEGELVTETRHVFDIDAGDSTVLGLRATTDKARYSTTDVVQINALLQNSSTNVLVEDALLNVTIKGPEQQILHTESRALNSLPPNGMQQIILPYMLQNATLGTYTLDIEVLAHDNTVLANQTNTFQVTEEQDAILLGQMDVSLAQLTRGQIQHCTQTLTNTGTQNLSDLAIQHLLIDLDTQTTLMSQDDNLTLAVGENHSQTITHYTQQLPVGYYACVLQAYIDGQWQVLDFKTFNLHSVLSSECSTVYAVHDQKREDSQIFTYDLNQDLIQPLGPLYLGYDLEGLDVHPYTHQIFASAGKENAHLYQVDGYTGDLTPLGITGFDDIVALSFDATGTLWGWSKQGLIRLSLDTGKGQLILPDQHTLEVEGLAWNNAGTLLYGAAMSASDQNSALWVYNPQQNTLEQRCANLPGEVESLEILPDDRLAFGIHDDKQLSFHIYDADACQTINHAKMRIPFNDVEAIAWPTANCNAQQQALRAFLTALTDDIFVGEDRNLRVSLDGQTHVGQLAEASR